MGASQLQIQVPERVEIKCGLDRCLSRTQISTQDVTQLCHEIRDIKKGSINNQLPDDLSKIPSNTPGQWDIRDKRVLGYAENAYNKLSSLPVTVTTAQHIVIHLHPQIRHHLLKRPPGPPPFRIPSPASKTSAGTPYAIVVPGSGELPADAENRARNSPCKS